jgi:outer membrane lipoprotein-sorting protein
VVLLADRNILPRRWSAALSGLVCLALLLGGCAASTPTVPAVPTAAPESLQFQQQTDALIERARRLDAMQAEAVMAYAGGGQHVKVREEVALKRPASLRVEAMSPFGVAAVVAANGSTVVIYQPSDNTFYRGAATADTLSRFARIPLPPEQAVKLLMGLLPDSETNFAAPTAVRAENGLVVGSYQMPGGSVDELGFADGQLRMVRTRGHSGVAYEVNYSDYRDVGGLQFAHQLDAKFLNTGTQLNVKYSSVIVNPILSDSEFVLVPQGAARVLDLDHPAAESHG